MPYVSVCLSLPIIQYSVKSVHKRLHQWILLTKASYHPPALWWYQPPRGVAMRRKCSQFNPSLIKREKWVFIYISAPCLPHGQLTNSADYTSLLSLPPLLTPLTHWVYFIRLLLKVCVLCRNIRFGFKLCGFFRPQWRIFLFGRNALQTFV